MKTASTKINRRSFLKVTSLTGGGMLLSLNWLAACKPSQDESLGMPKEWFQFNGFIKIGENGKVTIMSPNPEGGQNVKTSMPMIVAEELDVDWKNVIVEQADLDTKYFTRQFIGGSQAIRSGYTSLRTAGATARAMLVAAAAKSWNVPADGITVKSSTIYHKASDKSANFGEFASLAATMPVPEEVQLKANNNFTIIGSSKKNVEAKNIVTGKPLFGIDTQCEGMLIAMIIHPPAFGKQLKSFDDSKARKMPGIKDVFRIKPLQDDYKRTFFDTVQFTDLIAIVGNSTWEVLQAKKVIQTEWEIQEAYEEKRDMFGREGTRVVPRGLESTTSQEQAMKKAAKTPRVQRKDGDRKSVV